MLKFLLYFLSIVLFLSACKTIPPKLSEFKSSSDIVAEGEPVTISWDIANGQEFLISINDIGYSLPPSGFKKIVLTKSQNFNLVVKKDETIYIDQSLYVKVTPKPKPVIEKKPEPKPVVIDFKKYKTRKKRKKINITNTCTDVSEGPDDGRFTIGVDVDGVSKRLMYGFPIPHSTSHFVININGNLASNSPYFEYYGENKICYISGEAMTRGSSKSIAYSVKYKFKNVEIIQNMIPVDGNFRDVVPNSWGQYYRIEYVIINKDNSSVNVGLMLLIDTMIDDNDAAQMNDGQSDIFIEKEFSSPNVPDNIFVYYDINDKNSLTGLLNLNKGKAVKPDKLYIGRWPYFHSIPWDVVVQPVKYYDSAILCLWDNKEVAPFDTLYVATHYGSTSPKNKIRGLLNVDFTEDIIEFQFPMGIKKLSRKQIKELSEFIKNKSILGAVVEGFSDAVGSSKINELVSKRRAQYVKLNLKKLGIPEDFIIVKYYGERFADQSHGAVRKGNPYDRRVLVKLFVQQ